MYHLDLSYAHAKARHNELLQQAAHYRLVQQARQASGRAGFLQVLNGRLARFTDTLRHLSQSPAQAPAAS